MHEGARTSCQRKRNPALTPTQIHGSREDFRKEILQHPVSPLVRNRQGLLNISKVSGCSTSDGLMSFAPRWDRLQVQGLFRQVELPMLQILETLTKQETE